jgi:hypothetical protein
MQAVEAEAGQGPAGSPQKVSSAVMLERFAAMTSIA